MDLKVTPLPVIGWSADSKVTRWTLAFLASARLFTFGLLVGAGASFVCPPCFSLARIVTGQANLPDSLNTI